MLRRCITVLSIATVIILACSAAAPQQNNTSDALIFVYPRGDQVQLVIAYPSTVPHAAVKEHIQKLVAIAGWQIASLAIKDDPDYDNQTGATVMLRNAPQIRESGFWLQPYIEAFQDLNQFEILYVIPPDPAFMGLRGFENPAVSVRLVHEGDPYRYVIRIRDHAGKLPILPITVPPPAEQPGTQPANGRSAIGQFALVAVVAAAAGLVVFALLFYRSKRASQIRNPGPNRS